MESSSIEYKSLGLQNGWKYTPHEVIKCLQLGHIPIEKKSLGWSCYHIVYCEKCKIQYSYDSSG